jgi:ferredoxin
VTDLRGGFWPGMTGGLCARCHIEIQRGDSDEPDPDHPECVTAWTKEPQP